MSYEAYRIVSEPSKGYAYIELSNDYSFNRQALVKILSSSEVEKVVQLISSDGQLGKSVGKNLDGYTVYANYPNIRQIDDFYRGLKCKAMNFDEFYTLNSNKKQEGGIIRRSLRKLSNRAQRKKRSSATRLR